MSWRGRSTSPTARSIDNSELVFVGYGVDAPEFNWNDFKDVDVKGKTLVVLVNDPPVPDPADPAKLDPKMFGGNAMTYYGRWTYKFEKARAKGAAGVLIVHETEPAGYPFPVVQGNLGEKFDLVTPDKNMGRAAIEGWISLDAAKKLLAMAGQDFDALKKQAATREFKPVPLGVTASMALKNTLRTIDSQNVVAKLEGSDPRLEGRVRRLHGALGSPRRRRSRGDGDRIYNGALDNAIGRGGAARDRARVHAGAAAAEALDPVPDGHRRGAGAARVAVLRGHADLSARQDRRQHQHRRRQPVGTHEGHHASSAWAPPISTTTLRDAAGEQGRTLTPDPEPEKGFYYRSDHFNFAKQGVPALYTDTGVEFIGKPPDYGKTKRDEYTENGLPRAVRRGEARLGSERRRRGCAAAASRSATGSPTPTSSRNGSRATSSRPRAKNR